MQVTFENVRKEGSIITARANHNCGEHLFNVRIEGVTTLDRSDGLKLFTEPKEYATEEFALKGAASLIYRVLETDKVVYFKGNIHGGKGEDSITLPIWLAERFNYDLGERIVREGLPQLSAF